MRNPFLKRRKRRTTKPLIQPKNLQELMESLDNSFTFLSKTFKISGTESQDLKQSLYLKLVREYPLNKEKTKGWWFMRARWHLLNILKKSERDPLNNGVSIDAFENNFDKTSEG